MMAKDIENLAQEDQVSFFELNDTIVTKVSDEHYKKFFGGKTSGYLLFYRRADKEINVENNLN